MKKITKKRKAKSVREDALKQLRKTKAKIEKDHPDLFAAIKRLVAKAESAENDQEAEQPNKELTPSREEMIAIDRQKNIEAVLKYAATNPQSKKIKETLKDFLN